MNFWSERLNFALSRSFEASSW